MHRLSNMSGDSIHAEILRDIIADAQERPSCANWAGCIVKQYSHLGMALPLSSSGLTGLIFLGFQANMKGQLCKVWDGLHVSPRTAPSKRAKLCKYSAWFLRPSQLRAVPSFKMPVSRLQLLMQFRIGFLMLCRLNRVRLLHQPSPGIFAAVVCARPGLWGMKDIYIMTAPHSNVGPHSPPVSFISSGC